VDQAETMPRDRNLLQQLQEYDDDITWQTLVHRLGHLGHKEDDEPPLAGGLSTELSPAIRASQSLAQQSSTLVDSSSSQDDEDAAHTDDDAEDIESSAPPKRSLPTQRGSMTRLGRSSVKGSMTRLGRSYSVAAPKRVMTRLGRRSADGGEPHYYATRPGRAPQKSSTLMTRLGKRSAMDARFKYFWPTFLAQRDEDEEEEERAAASAGFDARYGLSRSWPGSWLLETFPRSAKSLEKI
jgi:hypothetical protein